MPTASRLGISYVPVKGQRSLGNREAGGTRGQDKVAPESGLHSWRLWERRPKASAMDSSLMSLVPEGMVLPPNVKTRWQITMQQDPDLFSESPENT